jgi:hypothetical protein
MITLPVKQIEFKGNTYMILQRKNFTKRKPQFYLFDIKNKKYFSSLYPISDNLFWFDDRQKRYFIRFSNDKYEIFVI